MTRSSSLAWYRFSRGHQRGSLTGLVLSVAILAGLGMAALAGARATDTSYTTLLARSHPSTLSISTEGTLDPGTYARLAGVARVGVSDVSFNALPLSAKGAPELGTGNAVPVAGLDGEYFSQDRVSVVAGRRADPHSPTQFMATAQAEQQEHWHLGETVRMGIYTLAQIQSNGFGTARVPPSKVLDEKLVGTVVFTDTVVQDSVDRWPTYYLLTPAAARGFKSGYEWVQYNIALKPNASPSVVESEVIHSISNHHPYVLYNLSETEGEVNRSVRPLALALGVFGALALLASLLVGLQMSARRLQTRRSDAQVLRALGASRLEVLLDSALAPVVAIALGVILALALATMLSPLTLLGPVRALLPERVNFSVLILLPVAGAELLILIAGTLLFARRVAPDRRAAATSSAPSRVTRLARNLGLPAPAVAGVNFAFEAGRDHRGAPVRSVLVGVTVAVALITATLTFASGLSTLITHPALYGWNWNYALTSAQTVPSKSVAVLDQYRNKLKFSGASFADVEIDGVTVPVLLSGSNSAVSAPLIAGHGVRAKDQIVLGAATMAALHKRIGETVTVAYGAKKDYPAYLPPVAVTIVGSATLPAIGEAGTLHPSMGVGAILDDNAEPPYLKEAIRSLQLLPGHDMELVRFDPGVSVSTQHAIMQRAARAGTEQFTHLPGGAGVGDDVVVLGVQYPAEIINYRSTGSTPLWLSLAFALGVIIAFGLTIVASVRWRRRDLALLRTLGFTRRQLRAAIAWQASVAVLTGVIIGVPLGILLGRELWILFARQIYAVPLASVPTLALVVLALGAVVIANLVAVIPQQLAVRTPAAVVLRAE